MKTPRIEELLTSNSFPNWGKGVIETALTKDCVDSYLVLQALAEAFDERSKAILGIS